MRETIWIGDTGTFSIYNHKSGTGTACLSEVFNRMDVAGEQPDNTPEGVLRWGNNRKKVAKSKKRVLAKLSAKSKRINRSSK
jgi:hypothetical protein